MPDGTLNWGESFDRLEERRRIESRMCNVQMEQSLLAALLLKNSLVEILPPQLKADTFSNVEYGAVLETIVALGQGQASPISVAQALRPGDADFLSHLLDLVTHSAVGSLPPLIKSYAEKLIELARKRRLFALMEKTTLALTQEGPAESSGVMIARHLAELEMVAATATASRGPVTMIEAVDQAVDAGEARRRGEGRGILTGFPSLDEKLGGMDPGGVYILAGRPGSGKTALGLQIALNTAHQGHGVCVISLEMQAAQLGRRALALESGIPQAILRDGSWDCQNMDRIMRCKPKFAAMPMSIEDEGGLNIQMIAIKAKAAMRRHGVRLLVVDHLHIVATAAEATKMGPTWAVGQVSNGLKRIAKELDIPVLALAQLSRGVEGREDKRPTMSDLRQSGDIEQDAEAIMLLYRAEYYLSKSAPERGETQSPSSHEQAVANWHEAKQRLAGKAEVIFDKVRDGETGSVPMGFDGARTAFRELSA